MAMGRKGPHFGINRTKGDVVLLGIVQHGFLIEAAFHMLPFFIMSVDERERRTANARIESVVVCPACPLQF